MTGSATWVSSEPPSEVYADTVDMGYVRAGSGLEAMLHAHGWLLKKKGKHNRRFERVHLLMCKQPRKPVHTCDGTQHPVGDRAGQGGAGQGGAGQGNKPCFVSFIQLISLW